MFGDKVDDVPIVQVSIERSGDPEKNWAIGKALSKLRFVTGFTLYVRTFLTSHTHREEGILILAGGLTVHNLHDRKQFSEKSASSNVSMFDHAITVAASKYQVCTAYSSLLKIAYCFLYLTA
jgi:aromatic ring-opening dioxygenase catalytic subunit (LigB family)